MIRPPGALLYDALAGLDDGQGQGHLFAPVDALGVCKSVPVIDVPGHGAYLAEISADQGFLFAAGRLDVSRRFQIPPAVWAGLMPAPYFVRFLDRRSLEILRTVSLTKHGDSVPITAEIAAAELAHA